MASFDTPGRPLPGASAAWAAMVERLFSRARLGMILGLDRIARVLSLLGHPERKFPSIHVAGTNGKGSTSAFLATILGQERRVGLYTSPHLLAVNERVQIVEDGVAAPLPESELLQALLDVEAIAPDFGDLTFFEVLTTGALLALARADIDVCVVEAGIGAKLDATRMVDAEVSVLTDLSLEHTAILGDTLEAIASDKAFVMRPGRPLVYAGSTPEADRVVEREAAKEGVTTFRIGRELRIEPTAGGQFLLDLGDLALPPLTLPLAGGHQSRNAILAAKAARLFDPSLDASAIAEGLGRTKWPGRFDLRTVPGRAPLLLDGAHNPQGVLAFAEALQTAPLPGPKHLVFAAMDDKDARQMLEPLFPLVSSVIMTRPSGQPRARAPDDLAQLGEGRSLRMDAMESVQGAIDEADRRAQQDGGMVLVAGSLYLVGEALRLIARP